MAEKAAETSFEALDWERERVRLGLLGAIDNQEAALEAVEAFCFEQLLTERVVYLGGDDSLERWISARAQALVGEHAGDNARWLRSLRCINAPAPRIDEFLARERARQRLRRFESFESPEDYFVENLGDHAVILCHDPSSFGLEELDACDVVVYGDEHTPRIFQAEGRYFLCPGSLKEAGLLLLTEGDPQQTDGTGNSSIHCQLFNVQGQLLQDQWLPCLRGNSPLSRNKPQTRGPGEVA